MIYFHKILPWFLSPISLIIISLILFFVFKKKFYVYLTFALIIFFTNSYFANKFFYYIENSYPKINLDNISKVDSVVVLSGMLSRIEENNEFLIEWNDPDRFFAGIDLIINNKSDKLLFTQALLPWEIGQKSEGNILREKAIEFGVPKEKILLTKIVFNTEQESKSIANMIKKNSKIILITSAFHMQRAKFLFEKEGYIVIPYPVDFKVKNNKFSIIDLLPNTYSLQLFSIGIREIYGRFYYFYLKN